MDYLPIFLRLDSRPVVVVGGGAVALRKVRWLRKAGARVTVIAPRLHPQLRAQALRGELTHLATEFAATHLANAIAVVAATDDPAVNNAVSYAAREQRIPVNVVDDAALSTFIFPAIIDRSPLLVAVSSCGHAPVLARQVREQIEALLPARLGALARFMGGWRQAVQHKLGSLARRSFWERIAAGPVASRVLGGDEPGARRALERELIAQLPRESAAAHRAPGEVYLIGAGPGDADLLTLRALQLLQQADVILYDRLVSPQVLERARRDAELMFVGKESGQRGQQERIHELMVRLVREGKRVARLKGGDPLVFGRGGEEIEVLAANQIPYTIVPGITAALGAAAAAALPLTHRRLAHSVTFVSGHQEGGSTPDDWRWFANPRHTAVVYMAVAQLPAIVARLRAAGASAAHPVALVAHATLPQQRILRGSLADIVALAAREHVTPPALLIAGEVAGFDAASADADAGTLTAAGALSSVSALADARTAGSQASSRAGALA